MSVKSSAIILALVVLAAASNGAEVNDTSPSFSGIGRQGEQRREDDSNCGKVFWAGLRSLRDSIQSAIVRVDVNREEVAAGRGSAQMSQEAAVTIDNVSGSYKFVDDATGMAIFRTPRALTVYNPKGNVVAVHDPSEYDKLATGNMMPFDIFAAPVLLRSEIDAGYYGFEFFIDAFEGQENNTSCTEVDGGSEVVVESDTMRRTFLFKTDDATNEVYPVRLIFHSFAEGTNSWVQGASTDTQWDTKDGVRLPVIIKAKSTFGGGTRSTIAHLHWHSINSPIDASEFTIDGLGVRKGTLIADDRLGFKLTERFGEEVTETLMEPTRRTMEPARRTGAYWIIVFNGLIGVGVAVWFAWIRFRR